MWKTYKIINLLDEASEDIGKAKEILKTMRKKWKNLKYDEYEERIIKK